MHPHRLLSVVVVLAALVAPDVASAITGFPTTPSITSATGNVGNQPAGSPQWGDMPHLFGTTDAGTTVSFYTSSVCSGSPIGAGPATDFTGSTGIVAHVTTYGTTTIYAQAKDGANLLSACSTGFTYADHQPIPAPVIQTVSPQSPSTNRTVTVTGTKVAGFTTVKLAPVGQCPSSPLGQTITPASATTWSITFTAPANETTTFQAVGFNGFSEAGPCSGQASFTHDSTAPLAPTLSSTNPASPGNSIGPRVLGSAEAGSLIKIYSTADCTGGPAAIGPQTQLASSGIGVAVQQDHTTTLRATATDAAGNTSPCSSELVYAEDSQPPPVPALTSTSPGSPAQTVSPKVIGSAEAGSTVKLFATADCSGAPLASGTAGELASPGITVAVGADQTTTLRATATDAAGNTSACSLGWFYRSDSTAPAAPVLSSTDPASPASSTSPAVIGSAEPRSVVRLFATADCTGDPLATGTADELASPGITAAVGPDSTTTLTATATDAAGNTSPCSTPLSYTTATPVPPDTVSPETTLGSAPPALINRRTASFAFSSEPDARFECSLDNGPFAPCTSAGSFGGLRDGRHSFAVRAIDAVGNADPTPATAQFTVDATPPDTRITPKPKASITTRSSKVKLALSFTATEKGATFQCKLDRAAFSSCRSPQALTLKPGRHTFSVRAIDAAGNADATPAVATVTVRRPRR